MTSSKTALVLTSISAPNPVLQSLAAGAAKAGWDFLIIGDTKSPDSFELEHCRFFSVEEQQKLPFALAGICPTRHYARKNLGYLLAIQEGARVIVETDDDNFPRDAFFEPRRRELSGHLCRQTGWVNAYRYFTQTRIWPRGYPLNRIRTDTVPARLADLEVAILPAPIQQGLADENPDVDAIFRLVCDLPVTFEHGGNLLLKEGAFCPFNSQNTTWFQEVFPLLYLPAHCSFRMTDIWRGLIAQRILQTAGLAIAFHGPTVWQERNEHDLMRDFADEISGYTGYEEFVATLAGLNLSNGLDAMAENLRTVYGALTAKGFFGKEEPALVEAWCKDLAHVGMLRH